MATKKECDRCGKQWDPNETEAGFGEGRGDSELCIVRLELPKSDGRYDRPAVTKKVELCQNCGRLILAHVGKQPKVEGQ
jgi:ribosomal protein S27AE